MFEMFKGIGQVASLMRQLPKIKEEMEKLQQRVGQITAEGDAGAGMVKVRVNGRMEVLQCTLSDEVLRLNDREMLEELIKAATNQAIQKARQAVAEETSKVTSSLGLPVTPGALGGMGGLGLPGMG
jgi:DNA-binding YbaB/EbfC family protein